MRKQKIIFGMGFIISGKSVRLDSEVVKLESTRTEKREEVLKITLTFVSL